MIDIDLFDPDFVIDLKEFNDSASIYTVMRDHKITRAYVYGMIYNPKLLYNDFIKVGMSAPNLGEKREYQVGERIVRQIAWVPGWEAPHPFSDHGSGFWRNIEDFLIPKNQLPKNFNKNMLRVAVWDISARAHLNQIVSEDDDLTLATWAEGELAFQYKQSHDGKLPLLNITDPSKTKIYSKPYISKKVFNDLFSFS